MPPGLRMVHLRTVPDAWHANVLAARLGAEGIVTHLQGNLAGPYPFGAVSVMVEAGQADLAAELLLADEVESAFEEREASWHGAPAGTWPGDDDILPLVDGHGHAAGYLAAARATRRRRAIAALAALVVAGAPLLARFLGQ